MAQIVLQPESDIYILFQHLVTNADRVFFAGLPGVGKSLMLQQLTLMAQEAGRTVHLLQWDTTRPAFETSEVLAKYPEIDGVTHAMIRKAVGMWARQGVAEWDKSHDKPEHMLIGEVPLVGNRLMELAKYYDDDVEAILSDVKTQFITPVPSKAVRDVIETNRERTIIDPSHEKESQDAPPNVLRALWRDLYQLAGQSGLTDGQAESVPYSPEIYSTVYRHLLQHRHGQPIEINEVLKPAGSAYDMDTIVHEIRATPEQVSEILMRLERDFTLDQVQANVERWYEV
jgi:hypothetical protein